MIKSLCSMRSSTSVDGPNLALVEEVLKIALRAYCV